MNYILYMSYMKDAETAANQSRASSHLTLFQQAVSLKGEMDQVNSPSVNKQVG